MQSARREAGSATNAEGDNPEGSAADCKSAVRSVTVWKGIFLVFPAKECGALPRRRYAMGLCFGDLDAAL